MRLSVPVPANVNMTLLTQLVTERQRSGKGSIFSHICLFVYLFTGWSLTGSQPPVQDLALVPHPVPCK